MSTFLGARREEYIGEGGSGAGACAVPVAVPDIFLAVKTASSGIDRCHSLPFLASAPGGGRVAPPYGGFFAYFLAETRKQGFLQGSGLLYSMSMSLLCT